MEMTRKILERAGYSVRCAAGFAAAQEMLMDFTPDGIILENNSADSAGFDYCGELRRETVVPIMVLSNSKDDELPALRAGATDFLKKPFDFDILKARVSVMLNDEAVYLPPPGEGDFEALAAEAKDQPPQEDAQEQPAHMNKGRMNRLYLAAAACLLAVFVGFAVYSKVISHPGLASLPEIDVPLSEWPFKIDENAGPYNGKNEFTC